MKKHIAAIAVFCAASLAFAGQVGQIVKTKNHSTADNKFTVSLPESWVKVDPKDPVFVQSRTQLKDKNPKIAAMMDQQMEGSDFALMVYDFGDDVADGFIDNMNVVFRPQAGLQESMLSQVGDQIASMLPAKGAVKHEVVKTKFGQTLTYSATLEVEVETGKLLVDVLGYLFLKNGDMYVVTFGCGGGQLPAKRKGFVTAFETIGLK